jgi:uncharacterized lipoprotein YddW (UPF0748 family)
MKNILATLILALSVLSNSVSVIANAQIKPNSLSKQKAVWITRVDYQTHFKNPNQTNQAIEKLKKIGVNRININVDFGCTVYQAKFQNENLQCQSPLYTNTDKVQEISRFAQANNIEVCAWFEYGFMTPTNSTTIKKNPEVLLKNKEGSIYDSKEHSWLNPNHPLVQDITTAKVNTFLSRYPNINCIQFDDHLGYNSEMGYDNLTANLYKLEKKVKEPPQNFNDADWVKWRADKVTNSVTKITSNIRKINSKVKISISPNPIRFSYKNYLQDITKWTQIGIADELVFQVYRNNQKSFTNDLIDPSIKSLQSKVPVVIGLSSVINGKMLTGLEIQQQVETVKKLGYNGISLFHYNSIFYGKNETEAQRLELLKSF